MTPSTKITRRSRWKDLYFAGSIDWAVDLQQFTTDDFNAPADRPIIGKGCIEGVDKTVDSGELCEFTCELGFCPESLCTCTEEGTLKPLLMEIKGLNVVAYDATDAELTRLCKFACKYGVCPDDICVDANPRSEETRDPDDPVTIDDPNYVNPRDIHEANDAKCFIFKEPGHHDLSVAPCEWQCKAIVDAAREESNYTNFGCISTTPLNEDIPWQQAPDGLGLFINGVCSCNNWLVNEIAEVVMEALPIIAQVC